LNTIIKNPNKAVTAMSCLIVIFAVYKLIPEHPYNHHSQPNVVIIGIDSLRPDVLQDAGNVAPFIKSMVEENTTYQNTYTPLARTFPAWISILTGRYPSSTEIRVNLQSPEQIKQPVSLGHFLQDQGYTTIYATDEKRFSNIDESYGFDKTIGPEIGIHDFLFSHFSDFPLSNLISDWRISQYLFPYTYANRAADRLYNPDTFVDLSLREIKDTVSTGKPFFIAAHFCLPHWPYTWKGYVPTDNHKENYLATVQRVDQQVKDFMLGLEQAAMLENTIIVLLSDHGETFAEKDRVDNQKIALKNFSSPHFDYSHHHGNDLASINQNKVLLTFIDNTIRQDFSKKLQPNWLTSLIDIAPTLTNYLDDNKNHPIYQKFDGISLFEKQHHASDRSLFLETGFTASSIDDIKFSIENVIEETIDFYTVDVDTGRLQVVPDKQQNIIKTKQRGIVTQDWLLVHHPVAHGTAEITLIDLESGNTFCDHAHSGDSIHHSKQAQCISEISVQEKKIANHLLSQLRAFYGNEIQL
jgi:arylsulfatase A-like enzyme